MTFFTLIDIKIEIKIYFKECTMYRLYFREREISLEIILILKNNFKYSCSILQK